MPQDPARLQQRARIESGRPSEEEADAARAVVRPLWHGPARDVFWVWEQVDGGDEPRLLVLGTCRMATVELREDGPAELVWSLHFHDVAYLSLVEASRGRSAPYVRLHSLVGLDLTFQCQQLIAPLLKKLWRKCVAANALRPPHQWPKAQDGVLALLPEGTALPQASDKMAERFVDFFKAACEYQGAFAPLAGTDYLWGAFMAADGDGDDGPEDGEDGEETDDAPVSVDLRRVFPPKGEPGRERSAGTATAAQAARRAEAAALAPMPDSVQDTPREANIKVLAALSDSLALAECVGELSATELPWVGDEGLAYLLQRLRLDKLRVLRAVGLSVGEPGLVLLPAAVQRLPTCALRVVDLSNNPIGDGGALLLCDALEGLPIEALALTNCGVSATGAARLSELLTSDAWAAGLAELELGHNDLGAGDASARLAGALEHARALRVLKLHDAGVDAEPVCGAIASNPHLQLSLDALDLSGTSLSRQALEALEALTGAAAGLTLAVNHASLAAGAASWEPLLRGVGSNAHLEAPAGLEACDVDLSAADWTPLARVPLHTVVLAHCGLGLDGIVAVAEALQDNAALEVLTLDCNVRLSFLRRKKAKMSAHVSGVGEAVARLLVDTPQRRMRVRQLALAGAGDFFMREAVVPVIHALATNATLTELDISGNRGGDAVAEALGTVLPENSTLARLRWDDNKWGVAGLQTFVHGLEQNSTLVDMDSLERDVQRAHRKFNEPEALSLAMTAVERALRRNQGSAGRVRWGTMDAMDEAALYEPRRTSNYGLEASSRASGGMAARGSGGMAATIAGVIAEEFGGGGGSDAGSDSRASGSDVGEEDRPSETVKPGMRTRIVRVNGEWVVVDEVTGERVKLRPEDEEGAAGAADPPPAPAPSHSRMESAPAALQSAAEPAEEPQEVDEEAAREFCRMGGWLHLRTGRAVKRWREVFVELSETGTTLLALDGPGGSVQSSLILSEVTNVRADDSVAPPDSSMGVFRASALSASWTLACSSFGLSGWLQHLSELARVETARAIASGAVRPQRSQSLGMRARRRISQVSVAVRSLSVADRQRSGSGGRGDDVVRVPLQAPEMVPDSASNACQLCDAPFTVTSRRHHCRACGALVCHACSPFAVFDENASRRVRVCTPCYNQYSGAALTESLREAASGVDGGGSAGVEASVSADVEAEGEGMESVAEE